MKIEPIPANWRPDPPAPELTIEEPIKVKVAGWVKGSKEDTQVETQQFVGENVYRIGAVLSVDAEYICATRECEVTLYGADGLLVIHGYEVGRMSQGAANLMTLLSWFRFDVLGSDIFGPPLFAAGLKSWTRAGFTEREIQLQERR